MKSQRVAWLAVFFNTFILENKSQLAIIESGFLSDRKLSILILPQNRALLQTSNIHVEFPGILGLRSRLTLQSNRVGHVERVPKMAFVS